MKPKNFTLALAAVVLFVLPNNSQAEQLTEKLIGQCTLTKYTNKKGKGSEVINKPVALVVSQRIFSTIEKPSRYDYVRLEVRQAPKQYFSANIYQKSYDNDITAPMVNLTKTYANDLKKLDIFFQSESYEKIRFTYDYRKGVGKWDVRTKINTFGGIFGIKTKREHYVYELRDCDFQGPVDFNPNL